MCPEALLKFKSKQHVLPFSLSLFLFLLLCSLSQQRANLLNDRLRSCLFLNSFPLLVPSISPYLLLSRPFHQPPTNPCHRSLLLRSILHMVLSMVILKTFITVYVYLSSAERSLWAPYCLWNQVQTLPCYAGPFSTSPKLTLVLFCITLLINEWMSKLMNTVLISKVTWNQELYQLCVSFMMHLIVLFPLY